MNDPNQKLNFHYKCKINEIIYNIRLFNIQQEKIKIMIDTKNFYSDDYVEYSNIYTLVQFKEITRYFLLFENIKEVFEDLSRIIQDKNFSIIHNDNTINFTIKVMINRNVNEVNFILDKRKIIDLSSQKDNTYFNNNTLSTKNSEKNQKKQYLEKSRRNIEISNINELNSLLSDLKDRISILETNQNNQNNLNNNIINTYDNNDNISQGLENILIRLNKLEKDNDYKDKIIEKLEEKIRYYESTNNNNNIKMNNINNINNFENDNNNNFNNNTPNFGINEQNNNTIPSYYIKYQLQEQTLPSLTYNAKNNNNNTYKSKNEMYIKDKNNINNNRLKTSKSGFFKSNNYYNYYNNNEKISYTDKNNNNNNYRNKSYNNKNISFRDTDRSYGEKDTFRSNKFNNSYANDINSNYAKVNNSNLNSTFSNYSNANDKNFQKYSYYKEKLGIPIVPREDLKKYINSRIIFTKNELKLLKTKLSKGIKKLHVFFDLLYRASMDGDFEEIIKKNVLNKEKTLTLFYTYEGSRFGVYIYKALGTSILKGKIYKEVPGTSFIVSLNHLRFFDIMENKTSKGGKEDYLSFGRTYYLNANSSNWLIYTPKSNFLKKRCIIGNQQGDYYDYDPELLVGKKKEYHIKDVEIFEVVFEKDDEEEDEKKTNNKNN